MLVKPKTIDGRIAFVVSLLIAALSFCSIFDIPTLHKWAPIALFVVFIVMRFVWKEPVEINVAAVVLAVFACVYVYTIHDPERSLYYEAFPYINAVVCFLIGLNFFTGSAPLEKRFANLKVFFFVVALFYMIYVSITYGNYLLHKDVAPELERHYWSIWYPGEAQTVKASTGFSASLLFAVVWGVYSLFFHKKWYVKVLGVLFTAYAVAFNLHTGTRLLVYLTPVIFVCEFFVWIVFYKKKRKLGIGITAALLAAIALGVVYLVLNRDELAEKYGGSMLDRFFTMGFGSPLRWAYLKNVWSDFSFTYLGGGVHSRTFGTPHNMWFYLYDHGGIQSFLLFCLFTVLVAVAFVRMLANKNVKTEQKFFIATLMGMFFVEYMLEDLINPLPSFYALSMFTFGLVCCLAGIKAPEASLQSGESPAKDEEAV